MKERVEEARFDFRGGLNITSTHDSVDVHELLVCANARVLPGGGVQRRSAANKTHVTALGAAGTVKGIFDAGTHAIAIANGNLYWADAALATWTQVVPASGSFSTTVVADFAMYRDSATGAALVFIASGGKVYTYDPATHAVTRRDGTTGVPAAYSVRVYGDRVFYADNTNTLYWSKIGNGVVCTAGGLSDGGSAVIGQDFRDNISALETVGSSLLLATPTGVARFTGTGADVRIDADTFGVTATVGPSGLLGHTPAFKRIGDVVMMATPRGIYVVTEGGITSLSEKVQTPVNEGHGSTVSWPTAETSNIVIEDNPARNEAWFVYNTDKVLVYNYGFGAFYGPFTYGIATFLALGTATVSGVTFLLSGSHDGFIRKVDDTTLALDDGVTAYSHDIHLAPFAFKAGPHVRKKMRHVWLQMFTTAGATPVVTVLSDLAPAVDTGVLVSTSQGFSLGTPDSMRYDVDVEGYRLIVRVSGAAADAPVNSLPTLLGVVVDGSVMERI